MKRLFLCSIFCFAAAACSAPPATTRGITPPDTTVEPAPSWADLPPVSKPDPELGPIGSREAQYDKLCATERGDSFFKKVCGGVRPNIPDLAGLLKLVGLDEERAFALTGNSTSLVAMSVSALNPRIIVFPRVKDTLERPAELIALGFVRGEQFVEVVSRDLKTNEPNFYLVSFEQHCSYESGGCDLASLLTEEIEHDWTAYSIYAEQDLEKTTMDCRACHQPGGFGKGKILRMQELANPWLHWFPQRFVRRSDSDRVLTTQFMETHDVDAQYGGVPTATIGNALDEGSGAQLEALLRAEGYGDQPNAFDPRIEAEAKDGAMSTTWLAQFQVALRGEAISVPYPRADVTDEAKRAAASQKYRAVVTKAAPRETFIDIRDVFSEDAKEKLSFVPQTGADGKTVLVQMCSRCHDGRANPEVKRSRFNVQKLDQMPRDEKDFAIVRMQEPAGSPLQMPPWRAGRMTEEAIGAAIGELKK
jgi:mono/diheme cytochrome c family protein